MLTGGKNIWLLLGKSDIMGVRENEKEAQKMEREQQLRRGRTSQTNEAIKKCETSAVRGARQGKVVHKHNGGRRAEEEDEEEEGNLSPSKEQVMSRA